MEAVICAAPIPEQGRSVLPLDRYIYAVANKDSDALGRLYGCAGSSVYAYALSVLKNRQDAEDVLHDCFVSIFCSASSYRSAGKPMAWIMTIAKNLCLRKLRDRRRVSDIPEEDWERALEDGGALAPEDRLTIRACMERLGDEERQIVLLHAVSGFKHREIAQFMDLPLATVLSKYSRATGKLRKYLEGDN